MIEYIINPAFASDVRSNLATTLTRRSSIFAQLEIPLPTAA
jgi:hypothetical protein